MRCVLVSHTHWDREWYKTFQVFRARLVDTVDRVLDLLAEDPGFAFQLDGQTIVIEDYLAIRPERREELEAACRGGRLAVGPWYVQPDSLIPCGETHVRNLLEGIRVASSVGESARVAYTPDSFGHPAQFPQIFAGFGLGPFIYWRGHDVEIDDLPIDWVWRGPDGSEIAACHLSKGYFGAWGLPENVDAAVARLEPLAKEIAERSRRNTVLLMNGIDHQLPDSNTREVCEALSKATGWTVERGLLDVYTEGLSSEDVPNLDDSWPRFSGELVGGRASPLLPGVWSTHMDLKLANRACETILAGWVEPQAEVGRMLGVADERAAIRLAWRALLPNQAHDSICGCSQDRVHEHMNTRYDEILDLARETTQRVLERIAGLDVERQIQADPATGEMSIAVFNPSPYPRSGRVRMALDGFPAFTKRGIAPMLAANLGAEGFTVGDAPARLIVDRGNVRAMLTPDVPVHDIEFVAKDVPAFGHLRLPLRKSGAHADTIDHGREIGDDSVQVRAADDGTFEVRWGDTTFTGLAAIEDVGDRGDTYDFDLAEGTGPVLASVQIQRRRHASGLDALTVERVFDVPAGLVPDRSRRSDETVALTITTRALLVPGTHRVDLEVHVNNTARDHRLRLLFPTHRDTEHFDAATTFDIATRSVHPPDASKWVHAAHTTIPQQGFVHVNGLQVSAPGMIEADVDSNGTLALTLLRCVGWLGRPDLNSRPLEAGPALATPGAQCLGPIAFNLSLSPGLDARTAHDAELGLRAVPGGPTGATAGTALLEIEPAGIELSCLKPAENGDGSILRLGNPSDHSVNARVILGAPLASQISSICPTRLDETDEPGDFSLPDGILSIELPPRSLRTIRLRHVRPD